MPFPHRQVAAGPSQATSVLLLRSSVTASNVAASRGPSLAASVGGDVPPCPPVPVVAWGATPAHPPRTTASKQVP